MCLGRHFCNVILNKVFWAKSYPFQWVFAWVNIRQQPWRPIFFFSGSKDCKCCQTAHSWESPSPTHSLHQRVSDLSSSAEVTQRHRESRSPIHPLKLLGFSFPDRFLVSINPCSCWAWLAVSWIHFMCVQSVLGKFPPCAIPPPQQGWITSELQGFLISRNDAAIEERGWVLSLAQHYLLITLRVLLHSVKPGGGGWGGGHFSFSRWIKKAKRSMQENNPCIILATAA